MGSTLIFNDTLNLTSEQGFPSELVLETHKIKPFTADQLKGRLFKFKKPELRFYHPLPIRVYLVENIKGKWVYWGMTHVHRVTLDYVEKTTSGEFEIVDIFDYNRMKECFAIRDKRLEFDYFR